MLAGFSVAGCAHRRYVAQPPAAAPSEVAPTISGRYVEEGLASWYGAPFNGHRTSDGEVYDMYRFTAAHRTLPFGSMVRVTNLSNGRQTEVRINDRGPFVQGRVIDLSYAAAQALGLIGAGTAPIRLELIRGPNPNVGLFGVQVGAFLEEKRAEQLRERLAERYGAVTIQDFDSPNGLFYRVRVGRLPSQDAARQLAKQLRAEEQLITFVVRLDE